MGANNSSKISNINSALKNIKSEILADFVYNDHWDLIITMNKVTLQSDLNTIKKYIKNINVIESEDIMIPLSFSSNPISKL